MDYFFIAWRSKNSNGEPIFGSFIQKVDTGTSPDVVLSQALDLINIEHKVPYEDIRITAFNRI